MASRFDSDFGSCSHCGQGITEESIEFMEMNDAFTNTEVEYWRAVEGCYDVWVTGCEGKEIPTRSRDGRTFLYMFNPARREHGWLNLETDIMESESPYGI